MSNKEETTPKEKLSDRLKDLYSKWIYRDFMLDTEFLEMSAQAKQLEEAQVRWVKIDRENLPKGEVLTICLNEKSRFYKERFYGKLRTYYNQFICSSSHSSLINVTHYLDISKIEVEKD